MLNCTFNRNFTALLFTSWFRLEFRISYINGLYFFYVMNTFVILAHSFNEFLYFFLGKSSHSSVVACSLFTRPCVVSHLSVTLRLDSVYLLVECFRSYSPNKIFLNRCSFCGPSGLFDIFFQ